MLKEKLCRIVTTIIIVALAVIPVTVFAESQLERPTYQNKTVYCSLDCDFYAFENDKALAITEWSGKTGYYVKTGLLERQGPGAKYTKLGVIKHATLARVGGSKSGVWNF